jgi:hypothetical protein
MSNNGLKALSGGWNKHFRLDQFLESVLGQNWIDSSLLGPSGVGDLSNVPGVEDNILDNRFVSEGLKTTLCEGDDAAGASGKMLFHYV